MRTLLAVCVFSGMLIGAAGQPSGDALKSAREAIRKDKLDEAIGLLTKVLADNGKNKDALSLRAAVYDRLEKYSQAAADLTSLIALDKKHPDGYQQRGTVNFKMGKIRESIADFDRYIELEPKAKVSHWQRGISYFYAGQYDDGIKQFEGYQEYDSNDVENAVWRFMCMARRDGIDKARKAMLKIGDDKRVPMRQVYDLYKGDLEPADVLKSAKQGIERFYAHLYVGIYYDLSNNKELAQVHLNKATEGFRDSHNSWGSGPRYMWHVARIHRDLLAKDLKKD